MTTTTSNITLLTMTVPEAGEYMGLSRSASYTAAKRGDLPTIRLGTKKLLVPRATFFAMLGVQTPPVDSPVAARPDSGSNGARDVAAR